MAKICVTEKTANRQRWIEEGLQKLMLVKRFEDITVSELCQSLSLSRRSFYRYFTDLDDVLDSLMHHTFQDFGISDQYLGMEELEQNYALWIAHKELLDALAKSGLSSRLMKYALIYTNPEHIYECSGSEFRKEMHLFLIGGLVFMIIAWHAEGFPRSAREMAQISYRMLTEPVLTK